MSLTPANDSRVFLTPGTKVLLRTFPSRVFPSGFRKKNFHPLQHTTLLTGTFLFRRVSHIGTKYAIDGATIHKVSEFVKLADVSVRERAIEMRTWRIVQPV